MSNFLQTEIYDIRIISQKTFHAGFIEKGGLGDEKCSKFQMRLERFLPRLRSNKERPEKL